MSIINAQSNDCIDHTLQFKHLLSRSGVPLHLMKYEKFWETLKIHAGGDDKQWIQFAPPKDVAIIIYLYL